MKYDRHECFCCDKVIDTESNLGDNPLTIVPAYDGLWFRSVGNFGSKVFDQLPTRHEQMLQIMICDDCIKKNVSKVALIYDIKKHQTVDIKPFEPES